MKAIATIFAIALLVRLLALAYWLPKLSPDVDLDSYRSLARSLAGGRGFVGTAPDGRTLPNIARTPVYPVFLAGLMKCGGDQLGLFLAVQCLLGAATCGLTVLLARRWLPATAATAAGLLIALDPNSIVRCVDLRTETLFTLLLVLGALACGRRWLVAGVLWAAAAACRPIAVWLWLIVVLVVVVQGVRPSSILMFMAGFLVVLGIWVGRNAALTGRPFLSTMATYNLLMYRAAGVEAERTGATLDAVQSRWRDEYGDLQWFQNRRHFEDQRRQYRQIATRVLFSRPMAAIRQTATGWVKVLFGPGARSLDNSLHESGTPARWWPRLYAVVLIGLTFIAGIGACRLGRPVILLAGLVVYFVLLAGGPEANSRFRTPIMPALVILAAGAWRKT